jgi:phage head maturation protease
MAKMNKQYGRAIIQPTTIDTKTREVDVVFATETPVARFGWEENYNEVLSCEESAVRMERVNAGLPVLDTHDNRSVLKQMGRASKVWFNDKREACARLRFSQRDEAAKVFQDIVDGIITGISVGYRVFKFMREPQAGGKIPIYRAVDWMPIEISLAPVPADINSGVRAAAAEQNKVKIINFKSKRKMEEQRKDYEVVDDPVKKGDEITIDGEVYIAEEDGEVGDIIEVTPKEEPEGDRGAKPRRIRSATPPAPATPPAVDVEAIRTQATKQERDRLDAILTSTRAAKLPDAYGIELYKSKKPVEECRQTIIEKAVTGQAPAPNGSHDMRVGVEAVEKKRTAIQGAILHRVYPSVFKLENGATDYRGMTLVEMGKELLSERGVNVRGMDKMAVANLIFGRTHGSNDFPILFEAAIDKMLRADYTFVEEFWNQIARQTSVNDFRAKNLYQVESTNGMQETPEGSEIKYTSLVEGKQSIRVKSYAEGIKFTRQAFINDDLDALSIIPSRFVKDWDEIRGNLVWSLITDNVTMGDSKALFSADHKNVLTGAGSALSAASLAAAMLLFKKQTGLDGKRRIRVVPKFLIVPPELEVDARKLLTVITPANTQDVNVFANAFTIIVEPRLTNATAWYLSADPNAIDSLYYAYLQGNESLRVNNEDDFNTDSMKYAVRGDFGTAAVDFRGLVKANGAA